MQTDSFAARRAVDSDAAAAAEVWRFYERHGFVVAEYTDGRHKRGT
jgi:hypothetical protein